MPKVTTSAKNGSFVRGYLCGLKVSENGKCSLCKSNSLVGKIPNEVFRKLSDDYLTEQKEIQLAIPEKESKLETLKSSVANVTAFMEETKAITEIKELTATILNRFISKIVVGERAEKYSRTAAQEIEIHYRYIGLIDDVIKYPTEMQEIVA